MNVVIATAEPFGAYHLAPLVASARNSGIDAVHLLPVAHPTQGVAFPTSSDLGAITTTDRVVVTGGALQAWGEAVARAAIAAGVPAIFSELAYLEQHPHPRPPAFTAATTTSPAGADAITAHLGELPTTIVGSPLLDHLPAWTPTAGRALVLTTVSAESPDQGASLLAAATRLAADGWDVVVRPHPRENLGRWASFALDTSPDPATAAAGAEIVIGHPGTAFVSAAAVGAPVLSIVTEAWMTDRVPAGLAELGTPVTELENLAELAANPPTRDPGAMSYAIGPVGGSAGRFWDAIVSAA